MTTTHSITSTAAANREKHRTKKGAAGAGQFGEHDHTDPELAFGQAPAWPEDLGAEGYWGDVNVEVGSRTPWHEAQWVERAADGIASVSTPGHGGYKLSKERNAAIPAAYRRRSGWYEEDCEAYIVAFYHYDAVYGGKEGRDRDTDLANYDRGLRNWFPDAWEKVNDRELEPGESTAKDERVWGEANAHEYVGSTGAHKRDDGLYEVRARRQATGDEDVFLLTEEQYTTAKAEAAEELGSRYRLRIPEGIDPQPRPEPEPPKPAHTVAPVTDGLTAVAAAKVEKDLATRWSTTGHGVATLRTLIEDGYVTGKRVAVDGTDRKFYLQNENEGTAIPVSKVTWEAFGAPDTRTEKNKLSEALQIARAKADRFQRSVDSSWRPTTMQLSKLREARAAENAAYDAWMAAE